MERWRGRVALVTGASVGIGAEICRQLVKYELQVVGCARSLHLMQALAEEESVQSAPGTIRPIKCDLRNEEDIMAMFEEIRKTYSRLDICINNAAICHRGHVISGPNTTHQWKAMLDVNVMALSICTREAIKLMTDNNIDDGQIIHMSSLSAHRIPPNPSAIHFFCGTKVMVDALAEGQRRELRALRSNIRVSCISPGVVETEFFHRLLSEAEKEVELYNSVQVLQAEDIASAVVCILKAPPHVDITDIWIRPTNQVY